MLVAARGDELVGAAHVVIEGARCVLDLLVVAPDEQQAATEQRLLAIAEAMCEAYECGPMVVVRG